MSDAINTNFRSGMKGQTSGQKVDCTIHGSVSLRVVCHKCADRILRDNTELQEALIGVPDFARKCADESLAQRKRIGELENGLYGVLLATHAQYCPKPAGPQSESDLRLGSAEWEAISHHSACAYVSLLFLGEQHSPVEPEGLPERMPDPVEMREVPS